jgi:MoaA/NifB/PqqE/SkfB family radical SAM enzyme
MINPINCEIDLSNYCQLECDFCQFAQYRKENKVELDFDLLIKLVSDLKSLGTKTITFTGGGEPLLYSWFPEAVELVKKHDMGLGLITNGVLLNRWNYLIKEFTFIRVSLDASTKQTYEEVKGRDYFIRVIDNVAYAVGKGPTVGLSFVVCNGNKSEIPTVKLLGKELNVDYVQIKPLSGTYLEDITGDSITIYTQRHQVESELPCHIAGLVGIVGANGDVFYCCQKRGLEEGLLGNLGEDDFPVIWGRRHFINPQRLDCVTCRYMNYVRLLTHGEPVNCHKGFL